MRSSSSSSRRIDNTTTTSPSTNASLPSLSPPLSPATSPSLSPPFSFSGYPLYNDYDSLDDPFPSKVNTLKQYQSNALGVNLLHQSDYGNNNNNNTTTNTSTSSSFNNWFDNYYYNTSSIQHPIESLLNSDISAKNNACQSNTQQQLIPDTIYAIPDNGQYNNDTSSNNNTFENTIFQQLQGFNIAKKHLSMKNSNTTSAMSSSPQTPRDGAALFSSFDTSLPMNFGMGVGGGQGQGMNKNTAAAEFDFGEYLCFGDPIDLQDSLSDMDYPPCPRYQTDMLAASFLNDQVAAFDSAPSAAAGSLGNNGNTINTTENFFANLPLIGSPLNLASNMNASSNSPPPLQNAFRSFSNAGNMNIMVDGGVQQPSMPPRSTSMLSSSSTSSLPSPNLASPAFDASGNFPFIFNNNASGSVNSNFNTSPNYSGIDTPALVMDDGNDLVPSLSTSPMWGQLDLGSISLFPQQQQQQQQSKTGTISPKELALPLISEKTTNNTSSFKDQVKPASVVTSFSSPLSKTNNKKRVRDSPAFGDEGEDADEETQTVANTVNKKARRSTSALPSTAPAGQFNGTRHTSNAPLPLDAPTQPRTYHGPESKTSKRAVPAAAARKVAAIKAQAEMMKQTQQDRLRSVSVAVEEDEVAADVLLDDEKVEEVIEMSIEAKRRQNTIAARRSRQRKAEHLAGLEESIRLLNERVNSLENEKMVWMMRAIAAGWTEDSRSL